jgi:hypothetical protein
MKPSKLAVLAVAAFSFALPASAQSSADTQLPPVEIRAKKNPGDAPYATAYTYQQRVIGLLAPEPRLLDVRMRLMFTGLTLVEQDDFMPANWGVAIVGETMDQTVPMAKGGYFLLPDLPIARSEAATLMFNTQTKENYLGFTWSVRVREGNLLPYRDFAKAIAEFDTMKRKVRWYERRLRELPSMKMSGLRACFVGGEGAILLDGAASGAFARGRCWLIKFDPAKGDTDATIAFSGELESLTLH